MERNEENEMLKLSEIDVNKCFIDDTAKEKNATSLLLKALKILSAPYSIQQHMPDCRQKRTHANWYIIF